ncbi:MAG: SDR family NAD(P)-dependent oxidoreductase [Lachnospiraceae bacterium]|nr:SDR family NAD(P)-dependent oxidoreductase [Lachnospiraceae bacterium]
MSRRRKRIVIITGASSGLGKEFALQLDRILYKTDEMWLIARRKERLEELAKSLSISTRLLPMDVTGQEDMAAFRKLLEKEQVAVHMLINCAGFGLMGGFAELDVEEQMTMIEVDCKALMRMTHYCLPYMHRNAHILQLASSAAFLPQKNFAIYAACKSCVLSFSRALGEELRERQIWVTAVCPGPVDTEFFDIAERYGSTLAVKKLTMVSADKVVGMALRDAAKKRPVSVCSLPMQAFWILAKILPHSWILQGMNLLK